jgi:ABC-type bacteriocin/lantibiotic exporter with double-glycine peptidase domain
LVELIRELQWPDLSKGTTLSALSECLRNRGIETKLVHFDQGESIIWDEPVILHLDGAEGTVDDARSTPGHFVAILPVEGSGWKVADGVRVTLVHDLSSWLAHASGYMLLTSSPDSKASKSEIVSGVMIDPDILSVVAAAMSAVTLALIVCYLKFERYSASSKVRRINR